MDSGLIQKMKDTQFDKFAYETRSQLAIVGCKYLKTWDCTGKDVNGTLLDKEENPWKEIHTQFGYCQTLNPSKNYPGQYNSKFYFTTRFQFYDRNIFPMVAKLSYR